MKRFIVKTSAFLLVFLFLFVLGLFLPPTPRTGQSLLSAERQKDSLLMHVKEPRIVFVGGSNLSFGLNSQAVKDSLHLNPINTAIHASIGLKYMMDNVYPYIQKGDVVVFVLEYDYFFRDLESASVELLRICDMNRSKYRLLNSKQVFNLLEFIPKLSISKLLPSEYRIKVDTADVYVVHSFNNYGDAYKHWGLGRESFLPYASLDAKFNEQVIRELMQFQSKVSAKGATLFVSYPGYQDISFLKSLQAIKEVELHYKQNGFSILGTPERYRMPDSLMYNTPYHLNKRGVDYRTQLLIEDLKKALH
jgi:hypothetical protein